jgi:hypothetical protein
MIAQTEILTAKRRRLRELEKKAALLGYDTPPQIVTEIQDIRAEITTTNDPLAVLPTERFGVLLDLIEETRRDVSRLYFLLPLAMLLYCILLVVLVKL